MDIHGVRFDIFATLEDGRTVEIEMQVLNTGHLPKRLRFYSSMADAQMLEKGVVYSNLSDSYVIMICPFDQYGQGRHIYTFVFSRTQLTTVFETANTLKLRLRVRCIGS